MRSLAQPRKGKAQPTRASGEFDVTPDFVEGKRYRGDGAESAAAEEAAEEAKAKRTVYVRRMEELAKPIREKIWRNRPKSAERTSAWRSPDYLPGDDPAAVYCENLPHRLDPNRPRAVQSVMPAKPTWEAQQAAMRRLVARKEKHAAEEVRAIAQSKSSDLATAARELVAGEVSAELRSYFEEVLWTALSLAREFGAVQELAETVGWCKPEAPDSAPSLYPAGNLAQRIVVEFPALAKELATWRIPAEEDELVAIERLRQGRDALLRLAHRARLPTLRPRLARIDEEQRGERGALPHWTADLREVKTPRSEGLVGYSLAKGARR